MRYAAYATPIILIVMCAVSIVLFLPPPSIAHAQFDETAADAYKGLFVPLADFSGSPRLRETYASQDLKGFMNNLFVAAIAIGGILAVLRLAWAGFVYMGTDMWGQKEHAKEIIQDALIGLFLLLAIWIILKQINPDILKLDVNFKSDSPATGASPAGSSPADENAFISTYGKTAPTSGKTAPTTNTAPQKTAPATKPSTSAPPKYWCFQGAWGGTYCKETKEACENKRSSIGTLKFGGDCQFNSPGSAFDSYCPEGQGWNGTNCSSDPFYASGSGTYKNLEDAPQGAYCYERSAGVSLVANRYNCFQTSAICTGTRGFGSGPCFENNAQ